ncbi:RICIN domain-containing protein [Nocardia beijingensis]|uniref:RICIN domain-containing protein n=1 Tax=Nocardia beijingensis TaxID=95162 RepID=UPI00189636CD|nr:RICIN domain-containing protein [Nocardia beijingensis]MBF6078592.1 RICIN domain-containing protein [Nocardia beijingensis]
MTELGEGVYRIVNAGTGCVLALESADQVRVVGERSVEDGWQHWLLSSAPEFGEEIWYITNGRTGTRLGLGDGLVSEGTHVECSGTPMGWQIVTDEADADRYRIAVWPSCDFVLGLSGRDDSGSDAEQIGLTRYAPASSTQRWQFQRA